MTTAPDHVRPMGGTTAEAQGSVPAPDAAVKLMEARALAPTREEIEHLHALRQQRDGLKVVVDGAKELLEEAFAGDLEEIRRLGLHIAQADEEIKTRAVAAAAASEGALRKPAPGVEVKYWTRAAYLEADALAWAEKHAPSLITKVLDAKRFEEAAEALGLPFVTFTKEPRAQLAGDLGKALAKEDVKPLLAPRVAAVVDQVRGQAGGAR